MQVNAMYIQDSYYIQSAKCLILETGNVVTVFWWNMITSFYDDYQLNALRNAGCIVFNLTLAQQQNNSHCSVETITSFLEF